MLSRQDLSTTTIHEQAPQSHHSIVSSKLITFFVLKNILGMTIKFTCKEQLLILATSFFLLAAIYFRLVLFHLFLQMQNPAEVVSKVST